MNYPVGPFIKKYFSYYLPSQKGLAGNTILAYRDAVKLLLCHASETLKKSIVDIYVEDINEYCILKFLDHLEQTHRCKTRTRNARLAAIKSLFAFISREEPDLIVQCQQIQAIPLKRTEHRAIKYLEDKEIQTMLDAVDINSPTGIRDQALLLLLYNTGARVSEIAGLKLDDLQLAGSAQIKLVAKGNKERSFPLWAETVVALRNYLRKRNPKQSDTNYIFLNNNGLTISRFGIRYLVRKYGFLAKDQLPSMSTVNPHVIRHTTAMHLLRAGNEINMISYWLGHADINTTHIYVEIDMEMKRKMLDSVDSPSIDGEAPWQKPDILKWLDQLTNRLNYVE